MCGSITDLRHAYQKGTVLSRSSGEGTHGGSKGIAPGWLAHAGRNGRERLGFVAAAGVALAVAVRVRLTGEHRQRINTAATGRLLRLVGGSDDPEAARRAVCQAVP